jgi:hypothetical protein
MFPGHFLAAFETALINDNWQSLAPDYRLWICSHHSKNNGLGTMSSYQFSQQAGIFSKFEYTA